MAEQTTDTIVDITRRFEWEVAKEKFEGGGVEDTLVSAFIVNIEGKVFTWGLGILIGDSEPVEQNWEVNEDSVYIGLNLLPGNDSVKVEVEGIGIKTEVGYWPGKPTKNTRGKSKVVSKIETFDGRNKDIEERLCETYVGSKDDVLKMFIKNKITVVATLRFYLDRDDYIRENEREQNLLTQIRSISDLDTLADFTVICNGREFKCQRNILASRSTVFKAMILNEQFEESRQNSTTIERASPAIVEAMLEFISNGKIPSDIHEKAIDLIDLADRYDLKDLIEICENSLVDNLTADTVIETLIAIDLHVPNSQHRQKIIDFIKEKAAEVAKSSHWKTFWEKYFDLATEVFISLASPAVRVTDN